MRTKTERRDFRSTENDDDGADVDEDECDCNRHHDSTAKPTPAARSHTSGDAHDVAPTMSDCAEAALCFRGVIY